ncbi:hypothetical protein JNA64_00090 [Pseudomonas stutzeri]|uniref:NACHT domain-containing protein n=1 Tax=Stutzerimonas stutzeri TaxID=316 RepID=UPI001F51782B|nr:hypothetical protein [Stutzerimonas stutzeri]MCI0915560.1 hypothetical protein [Stutzerimonas stutzeri]
MSYLLEQLGDERFQQLCQALLVSLFPEVQCFPVGQPDGGRDAQVRMKGKQGAELVIFQVKYTKDPLAKSSREIIQQVVESEKAKVQRLIEKGAKSYYLMTNVAGTSHLDAGSIDKINSVLSESLNIEVNCWWRDDIERRIDSFPAIKWSFPEILKATDLLEQLAGSLDDADKTRRLNSLAAYMAHQARYDAQLKFKQIELQKDIVDLFVDVPGCFYPAMNDSQKILRELASEVISSCEIAEDYEDDDMYERVAEEDDVIFPILQLLTRSDFSKHITRLVIEGAPGQGKSTVTQYLCQVNRLKILNKTSDLNRVDSTHLPSDTRIPFRVDLRDYANWLSGKNLFSKDRQDSCPPVLESFLAAQINYYTGSQFSVDDLIAIMKVSQILIVLDGFDEVADVAIRNRIVDEVSYAADRIQQNAISSLIIVTSRPAAFANSPGFSRGEWQHLKMLPLFKADINRYSVKWLEGRSLENKEKEEILSLLSDKLHHSHVRDLARNPMQLAILLALISVQGASLPDKRTALYDEYIDIFLNRESEKSDVVRDHRDLLVQIHRFLAWTLQSEAEEKSEAGNISEVRLRSVLREYLEEAGHATDLVDELFSGMVERVVALISRVQGTFEFEVQPLREYFAARYLYDTAPYAPPGRVKRGTLPERFDAIAKNFYWLNVTRFYSGCYNSGELSSLVDGLDDVAGYDAFKNIGHTSRLGFTLLKDHVFSQSPKLALKLMERIVDSHRLRIIIADNWYENRYSSEAANLPKGRATDLLVSKCVEMLRDTDKIDCRFALARIIQTNSDVKFVDSFWDSLVQSSPDLESVNIIGTALGVYDRYSDGEAIEFIRIHGAVALSAFVRHQRFSLLKDSWLHDLYFNYALDSLAGYVYIPSRYVADVPFTLIFLNLFGYLDNEYIASLLASESSDSAVHQVLQFGVLPNFRSKVSEGLIVIPDEFALLWKAVDRFLSSDLGVVARDISVSAEIVCEAEALWGERSALIRMAVSVVSYAGVLDSCPVVDVSDTSFSLIQRASCAKSMAHNLDWWTKQFRLAAQENYRSQEFLLLCVKNWMAPEVILSLYSELSSFLDKIPSSRLSRAFDAYAVLGNYTHKFPFSGVGGVPIVSCGGSRAACLILLRLDPAFRLAFWQSNFASYSGRDALVLEVGAMLLVEHAVSGAAPWQLALGYVRRAYAVGCLVHVIDNGSKIQNMPLDIAETICSNPISYPLSFVALAEDILKTRAGSEALPVGLVAREQQWIFSDDH